MADKSIKLPARTAKDILVNVDKFLFPVGFVVMDIKEDDGAPLILRRPFMKTARMMIDMDDCKTKMRLEDEEIGFSLFEAL